MAVKITLHQVKKSTRRASPALIASLRRFNNFFLLGSALVFGVVGWWFLGRGAAAPTISTLKAGNWSDITLWSAGRLPSASELVKISHSVNYDLDKTLVSSIWVDEGAQLQYAPTKNGLIESKGNVLIYGRLVMKPVSSLVNHTLRFVEVDETKFTGGGMDPIADDIGLWVMNKGQLHIAGSNKLSWGRANGSLAAGSQQFTMIEEPAGWQVGDEIVISPTAQGHYTQFDQRRITSVNGKQITLDKPLDYDHPAVTVKPQESYSAEVMNLTRNVQLEGSPPANPFQSSKNGRAHIFVRNTQPVIQELNYVDIRYMGPRKGSGNTTKFVPGRYGIHFHMSQENNRGTVVEGTVVRDTGSHAFVPHTSHGITFRNTVSYNTLETPYWWDVQSNDVGRFPSDMTNDTVWDRAVAALARVPTNGDIRLAGFSLASGSNNSNTRSVAVGIQGYQQASGFLWPEGANENFNVWRFEDNLAHNNLVDGIFTWQNDRDPHVVERFTAYHNGGAGIEHGAYRNGFIYRDSTLYANDSPESNKQQGEFMLHAVNNGGGIEGLVLEDIYADSAGRSKVGLYISHHRQNANSGPARLINWHVKGYTSKAVIINEFNTDSRDGEQQYSRYDLICWKVGEQERDLSPQDFQINWLHPQSQIRVQRRDGTAFQLNEDKTTSAIAKFTQCTKDPPDPVVDNMPPTAPGNLTATIKNPPQVQLAWNASNDNVGVKEYRVFRNSQLVVTVNSLSFTDATVQPGNTYEYTVRAIDAAGNLSPAATVNLSLPKQPRPGDQNGDGIVNGMDLSILLTNWGRTGPGVQGDQNGDGIVNGMDLSILLTNWTRSS